MIILITNYCKIITNYDKNLLQITAALLQITAKIYYKLPQKIITNYGSSYFCKIQIYYKLRKVLLHITATFSVITNYGRYYKLRRYHKLRRNIFHKTCLYTSSPVAKIIIKSVNILHLHVS